MTEWRGSYVRLGSLIGLVMKVAKTDREAPLKTYDMLQDVIGENGIPIRGWPRKWRRSWGTKFNEVKVKMLRLGRLSLWLKQERDGDEKNE